MEEGNSAHTRRIMKRRIPAFVLMAVILASGIAGFIAGVPERFMMNAGTVFQGRQFYRILTAMFLHADIMHLAQNLLCLFGVSDIFLASRSAVKYYLAYLGAGILGAAAELFVRYLLKDGTYALGASGAVMGVLGADIALVLKARRGPERPGLSSLLIRLGLLAAINLIPSPGNTDYLGHFFGFSAGFLIGLLL